MLTPTSTRGSPSEGTVSAVLIPIALLITVRCADVSPCLAGVFPGSQIGVKPGISTPLQERWNARKSGLV